MSHYEEPIILEQVADLLHVSYRTAVRRMKKMKADLGISRWQPVTRSMVEEYFF